MVLAIGAMAGTPGSAGFLTVTRGGTTIVSLGANLNSASNGSSVVSAILLPSFPSGSFAVSSSGPLSGVGCQAFVIPY